MGLDYIIRDEESGLCFVWNGAHTVNVRWGLDAEDHDVFSVGSYADNEASFTEFADGVREYLADDNE